MEIVGNGKYVWSAIRSIWSSPFLQNCLQSNEALCHSLVEALLLQYCNHIKVR